MRRKLRLFWRFLPRLLEAFVALVFVRLQLTLFGYDRVRSALSASNDARELDRPGSSDTSIDAEAIRPHPVLWSVRQAARLVPGATCLTQAIAAQSLLGRRGEPSTVRIGVRRDVRGGFHAHAWLLQHGRTVLGGDESPTQFSTITDLTPIGR